MNSIYSSINDIYPAILSFSATGIFVLYHAGGRKYYLIISKKITPVVLYSFIFIISGFCGQIFYEPIKDFFVSDQTKIVATVVGGFIVNSIIRYLSIQKEKQETSTLYYNNINSQVASLSPINSLLIPSYLDDVEEYIKIYKGRLINNQYHKDSFNKIGIYNYQEIELISRYSFSLDRCLNSIEKLLIDFHVQKEENQNKNQIQDTQKFRYKPSSFFFVILKIYITISILLGYILVYTLQLHSKNQKENMRFLMDYKEIITSFQELFVYSWFYKLNNVIAIDLVESLKYIREQYKLINSVTFNDSSIYICRLVSDEAIIKENDDQEFPLLTTPILAVNQSIISFGKSEEEAVDKSKSKLKHLILEDGFDEKEADEFVQKCKSNTEIISPWS